AAVRGDLDALVELFQRADLADVGFADPARDEILETWAQPWFDLARDSLVVQAPDDALVAYCEVVAKDPSIQLFGYAKVDPPHRRVGIGSYLVGWIESRAVERVPWGVTVPLRNGHASPDVAAAALFEARGYEHVRSFWHMQRDLEVGYPAPPDPEGITIRFGTKGDDQRAAWAILEEAFKDHFGYEPFAYDEWLAMWSAFPGYDPTWVLLAFEGEEPVGVSMLLPSEDIVWVGELGVLAHWRGRGIGMALLQRSFAFIASEGYGHVRIGVDTENTTGATRLYERAGTTVRREYRVVERRIEGAPRAD
ncbi:MAG: GNAT family N-acetyltransferase, partial [Actinomycetota bacterium]